MKQHLTVMLGVFLVLMFSASLIAMRVINRLCDWLS